ncbi:substrate-binding domain-containing protein [Nonomuraea sp. NPDC050022]|uniref:substrate-binding domain-containing protein n=1 Tax=Nonomuraea sp. NPDC050022 TaxID=3364358 RepID=UPI00379D6786
MVIPLLAPLVREGLRLRTTFGLSDELLTDLTVGRLDLVVSTIRPRARGIQAEAAYDEEFLLVADPCLAADRNLTTKSVAAESAIAGRLADVPLIAYAEDLPIVRRYWRTVFGKRPSMAAQVVIPDLRGVLNAVRAGMGVSVLPAYLCRADLAAGRLVTLAEPELAPINTGYLAVRSGGLARAAVARVHAHLLAALKSAPAY